MNNTMSDSKKRNNRWITVIVCYCAVMLIVLTGIRLWEYHSTVSAVPIEITDIPEPVTVLLIDINTAELDELVELPGIGEGLGKRIIEFRKKNGGFEKIEDIMLVDGIGQATFEKLKPLITV